MVRLVRYTLFIPPYKNNIIGLTNSPLEWHTKERPLEEEKEECPITQQLI